MPRGFLFLLFFFFLFSGGRPLGAGHFQVILLGFFLTPVPGPFRPEMSCFHFQVPSGRQIRCERITRLQRGEDDWKWRACGSGSATPTLPLQFYRQKTKICVPCNLRAHVWLPWFFLSGYVQRAWGRFRLSQTSPISGFAAVKAPVVRVCFFFFRPQRYRSISWSPNSLSVACLAEREVDVRLNHTDRLEAGWVCASRLPGSFFRDP